MAMILTSLPTEVLLKIIGILTPEPTLPTIGCDAAWVDLLSSFGKNARLLTHSGMTVDNKGLILTDVANLQRTSRRLHALCTPILHQDLNLLVEDVNNDEFALRQALKHSQHIRTIRFLLDHRFEVQAAKDGRPVHERCVINVLSICTHVTSISVYYHYPRHIAPQCRPSKNFRQQFFEVLSRKGRVQLKSLGFYSMQLLQNRNYIGSISDNVTWFMDQITSIPDVTCSLEHFDIVGEYFPPTLFTQLPLVKSISLRRSSSGSMTGVWTPEKIVDQVDLMISRCNIYYHEGSSSPSRRPGWSLGEDALHWTRQPLKCLHIEHVPRESFMSLGIIPSLHLVIGRGYDDYVEKSFIDDEELFPHLEKLSLESRLKKADESGQKESQIKMSSALKVILKKRGIHLEYNAVPRVPHA
ncbi:hypothetical protein CPB86DRAFT_821923 [Serendipita vermifera]|nr:hypothetical protein CPB86DRAFT_821923 [Serendipita vermifera]